MSIKNPKFFWFLRKHVLFLLYLLFGHTALSAVPLTEDWATYQNSVLEEHSTFAGWCPKKKALRMMNLLYQNPSDLCVEVGVFGGSSFFPIASTLAFKGQGIAYAIDPWTNDYCLEGYDQENEKHHKYWGKIDLERVMQRFIENMHRNGLDATYQIMRLSSAEACHHFKDESIDFLHIDGNHSEQSALFDVEHWLPKVKRGGIICFDDAWWKSTQPAIKRMLSECDVLEEFKSEWQYLFVRKKSL
jgi:hypothetical protein